jgi:hypothetical protein
MNDTFYLVLFFVQNGTHYSELRKTGMRRICGKSASPTVMMMMMMMMMIRFFVSNCRKKMNPSYGCCNRYDF